MAAVLCHLVADYQEVANTLGDLEGHWGLPCLTGDWRANLGAPAAGHQTWYGPCAAATMSVIPPALASLRPSHSHQYLEGMAWALTGGSARVISLTHKATH